MPSRTATFPVDTNFCSGGNHIGVGVEVNTVEIGRITGVIADLKDELGDPTNEQLSNACLVLLGYALNRANPSNKTEAKSVTDSASIVLTWTNP